MGRIAIALLVWSFMLAIGPGALTAGAAGMLTASEAGQHVGEQATVCGQVASAAFASRTRRQPTFLNLDKPYPNHIFTVVIWSSNRPAFGEPAPEAKYQSKRICVSGLIKLYQGRPEIIATSSAQITLAQ